MTNLSAKERASIAKLKGGSQAVAFIEQNRKVHEAQEHSLATKREFEDRMAETQRMLTNLKTNGALQLAGAAVGGVAVGSGAVYFGHDYVTQELGKGSMLMLAFYPLLGAGGIYATRRAVKAGRKSIFKIEDLETKLFAYCASISVIAVGTYFAYEDYVAANPPTTP